MPAEATPPDADFEALLHFLKHSRAFDFSAYRRPYLMRRVQVRMLATTCANYADYLDYLQVHPEEYTALFDALHINVTTFFRDGPAWDALQTVYLPPLLAQKAEYDVVRCWSAGCASGMEAYSLAIALAEALGPRAFRERVKIYATDVDEQALAEARAASYPARNMVNVPAELLAKYFDAVDGRYIVRKELRRAVIFGRHDLLQDAAISRIDVLMCRNTLMYMNADAQAKVLANLHFALNDDGVLMLGKAEMLLTQASLFAPRDLKLRLFRRMPRASVPERLRGMAHAEPEGGALAATRPTQLREMALDNGTLAQVVVDVEGLLSLVNEQARALFQLSVHDIGRPLQDLELSYRPAEVRSMIETAYAERRPQSLRSLRWPARDGGASILDVLVMPLVDRANHLLGASITFHDVTHFHRLQGELEEAHREIATAYEELQSTNEELETTNEELQSTVEELETTNEELHSTNEELETMNAELQSTNDELQTVNDDTRAKTAELNQVNSYLASILAGLQSGVAVLDPALKVQIWNPRAEDLWGLRETEVEGKPFLALTFGLPVAQLTTALHAALSGPGETTDCVLLSRSRLGQDFPCRVRCAPLAGTDGDSGGVIVLMEDAGGAMAP